MVGGLFVQVNFAMFKSHGCTSQVPNEITMQHEPLEKRELLRYTHKRRQQSLYRAATRLWGQGLAWHNAMAIVREAFDV